MDSRNSVDTGRRIPKPVLIAITAVLIVGALIWVLPLVLFFVFVAMGGQLG